MGLFRQPIGMQKQQFRLNELRNANAIIPSRNSDALASKLRKRASDYLHNSLSLFLSLWRVDERIRALADGTAYNIDAGRRDSLETRRPSTIRGGRGRFEKAFFSLDENSLPR